MKKSKHFQWEKVRLLPILHNRMEFAQVVRRQFEEYRPDLIAVEYPQTLKTKILEGIGRLPLLSVVHYEESDGTFVYLPIEPTDGMVEAVRLARAENLPVHFIDRDTEGYPLDREMMPDSYALTRIGHDVYCQAFLRTYKDFPMTPEDKLREKTMAFHLQRLNREGARILFVGGLAHLPGLLEMLEQPQTEVIGRRNRGGVNLAHLNRDSSREILNEMPYLAAQYEQARAENQTDRIDRMKIDQKLIKAAREAHWKNSKEEITSGQLRILNRFARNYALLSGALVPNFYQLIVACRGAVDDNFAYEVWDLGSDYPWQTEKPGIPELQLSGEDLFLDQKRIRFHRRLKTFRRRLVSIPVKKRKRERKPGEWQRDFQGLQICSYPPEDIVIEGYGHYLKKKALEIKADENSRIVPFTSSIMDGLDIRETIREWHQGKIFVKEGRPIKGKVGSVVLIFEPDISPGDKKEAFPWCVTWLGEHDQESDMAFYGTPAGEVMDGPGISRCQYGGFMLTYPPMRVYDIWKDPYFNGARNKPERLLMAALDYCLEKNVVYVAADPPSGWCRSTAARLGKKIIYLPIGIFSPVTLKKIKQFHVLDGHHVRRYAKDYIG